MSFVHLPLPELSSSAILQVTCSEGEMRYGRMVADSDFITSSGNLDCIGDVVGPADSGPFCRGPAVGRHPHGTTRGPEAVGIYDADAAASNALHTRSGSSIQPAFTG